MFHVKHREFEVVRIGSRHGVHLVSPKETYGFRIAHVFTDRFGQPGGFPLEIMSSDEQVFGPVDKMFHVKHHAWKRTGSAREMFHVKHRGRRGRLGWGLEGV